MKKRILIPTPQSHGGSGRGGSYWLSYLKCPRAGYLDRLTSSLPVVNEDRVIGPTDASYDSSVGVLVHKLLEIYYAGTYDDFVLEYAEGPENPAWVEALKIFAAYRELYPPNELGKVLHCEVKLRSKDPERLFGVPDFTGMMDMVVHLDEEACDILTSTRPWLGYLESGIYIVDHKTKKQKSATLAVEVQASLQFTAYQMLWQEAFPDLEIKGLIANYIYRHKIPAPDKSYHSYFVPTPNPERRSVLKHTLSKCAEIKEQRGEQWANPAWCFIYKGCSHFIGFGGTCDQTNK